MPYHEIRDGSVSDAERLLKSKRPVAIRIHMNGCGACHGMEDAWESVKELANKSTDVHVMNVDANAAAVLASKGHTIFNVGGFPTMLDKSGKEHGGGRSAEELTRWAEEAGKRSHEMGGGRSRRSRRRRRRRTRRKTMRRGAGRKSGKSKSRRTRRR